VHALGQGRALERKQRAGARAVWDDHALRRCSVWVRLLRCAHHKQACAACTFPRHGTASPTQARVYTPYPLCSSTTVTAELHKALAAARLALRDAAHGPDSSSSSSSSHGRHSSLRHQMLTRLSHMQRLFTTVAS
jgi:hypothetical protein